MKLDYFEFEVDKMDLGVLAKIRVEFMEINHIRKKILKEKTWGKHIEVEESLKLKSVEL